LSGTVDHSTSGAVMPKSYWPMSTSTNAPQAFSRIRMQTGADVLSMMYASFARLRP
jgi:hypothetical protein